ncbi:MAG: hypothetical protein QM796_07940 [Chthoniobacteraceae bacterium]
MTPNSLLRSLAVLSLATCLVPSLSWAADASPTPAKSTPIPDEFKDQDTGARMLHLSKLPNDASGVIYFTQPDSTPDSRYTLVRYLDIPARAHGGVHVSLRLQDRRAGEADRQGHQEPVAGAEIGQPLLHE